MTNDELEAQRERQTAEPLALPLNDQLGPLPTHRHSLNSGAFAPLYTADQMRAYAMAAVAAEHDRLNGLLRDLTQVCAEVNDHTPESWRRTVLRIGNKATILLRPNAALSGPPAGAARTGPAEGGSA